MSINHIGMLLSLYMYTHVTQPPAYNATMWDGTQEVVGEPHLEETALGPVNVLTLRVNVNVKSLTIDQLKARRKMLHTAMVKDLLHETRTQMQERSARVYETIDLDGGGSIAKEEVALMLAGYGHDYVETVYAVVGDTHLSRDMFYARVMPVLERYLTDEKNDREYALQRLEGILQRLATVDAEALNDDTVYQQHLNEALEGKSFARMCTGSSGSARMTRAASTGWPR
jgi:hypothetical protein